MSASASSSDRFPELDKYELLGEVGHGGMATVYRARDVRLDREVAVKVIHKHLRENPEVRRRFTSEAKAVAKLRHPSIVDVYDVSDDDDIERYLVVELIRGCSLRQLIQDCEPLPTEIAAIIVAILCDAVAHAHASGVIHRDIKPENVLVEVPQRKSEDGESDPGHSSERTSRRGVIVKLTDFGIAKVLDAQGVTSTGQILGSPAHMAPEQIEGGEIGPATDVFALGVLFYECMVGHLPFEGKNPAQVLRKVLDGLYEPAEAEAPAVGGHWSSIVDATLRLVPAERVESAEALRELIDGELESLGIEDQGEELIQYFSDPESYRATLVDRLVPRLLDRGEAAKKEGKIPEAAADFNRALALRPDDLTILKRVSSLTSQRVWKERGQRIGLLLLGSAALGGIAFGVTRLVSASAETTAATAAVPVPVARDQPSATPKESVSPDPSASTATPSAEPSAKDAPPPTAVPSDPVVRPAKPAPSGSAASEEPELALVRIQINPGGAKASLDGAVLANWLAPRELPIGTHTLRAWFDDGSCEQGSRTVEVVAPDNPKQVQAFALSLQCKPARFRLAAGAPPGAMVACQGTVAQGSSVGEVAMGHDASKRVSCRFSAPDGETTSQSVALLAGRTKVIPWPL